MAGVPPTGRATAPVAGTLVPAHPFDALILAGGRGRRLGGADKALLTVTGVRLLDHVLDAVAGAGRAVVVGPSRETLREVRWAREQPPGGGPVAGLAAGLPLVMAPVVAVLAVDLPFLRPEHVLRLCAELTPGDAGVVLSDDGGRAQVLAGVWQTAALREALPAIPAGVAMHRLVRGLRVRQVVLPGRPWRDVDTPADLASARTPSTGEC